MARLLTLLPWAFLAMLPLVAEAPPLEGVLRSELAFARQAKQNGIRTAFLAWLAEDAPAFSPRMVRASEFYGKEPGDPGQLAWYPEAMGIAASGNLAWSFGPWTYAPKMGGAVVAHGHFLSVWRNQGPEGWKVAADIGIPHLAPERTIPALTSPLAPAASGGGARPSEAGPALRQREAELSAAWAKQGGSALLPELAKAARVLRSGFLPAQGTPAIQKALEADRPGPKWEPAFLQVAPSGDLAWVCGEAGPDDQGLSSSFLRIWSLESGTWKVLFDVRLAHPQ